MFSLPLFLFKMDKSIVQDRVDDCKDRFVSKSLIRKLCNY